LQALGVECSILSGDNVRAVADVVRHGLPRRPPPPADKRDAPGSSAPAARC
jgi:hypothetical protein